MKALDEAEVEVCFLHAENPIFMLHHALNHIRLAKAWLKQQAARDERRNAANKYPEQT
jgi:hypothetical protein